MVAREIAGSLCVLGAVLAVFCIAGEDEPPEARLEIQIGEKQPLGAPIIAYVALTNVGKNELTYRHDGGSMPPGIFEKRLRPEKGTQEVCVWLKRSSEKHGGISTFTDTLEPGATLKGPLLLYTYSREELERLKANEYYNYEEPSLVPLPVGKYVLTLTIPAKPGDDFRGNERAIAAEAKFEVVDDADVRQKLADDLLLRLRCTDRKKPEFDDKSIVSYAVAVSKFGPVLTKLVPDLLHSDRERAGTAAGTLSKALEYGYEANDELRDAFVRAADRKNSGFEACVMHALSLISDERAISTLKKCLVDKERSVEVRDCAACFLAEAKGVKAEEAKTEVMDGKDKEQALMLALWLSAKNDRLAQPVLMEAANKKEVDPQVIRALGKFIDDPDVVTKIRALARSENAKTAETAKEILKWLPEE